MRLVPTVVRRASRDHPLVALGIVMGVLLVALLALPFVA